MSNKSTVQTEGRIRLSRRELLTGTSFVLGLAVIPSAETVTTSKAMEERAVALQNQEDVLSLDWEFQTYGQPPAERRVLRLRVKNDGTEPLAYVAVVPQFFGRGGNLIDIRYGEARDLAPNDTQELLFRSNTDVRAVEVEVSGRYQVDPGAAELPSTLVVDDVLETSTDSVSVRGSVRNTGGDTVEYLEVQIAFRNSDGVIIGTGFADRPELRSGSRWDYEILFPCGEFRRPEEVASHTRLVKGEWWETA